MVSRGPSPPRNERSDSEGTDDLGLARPSLPYRLKAWRIFQRALDPLAPPKPLRPPKPPILPH
jgi:hypothetical protein